LTNANGKSYEPLTKYCLKDFNLTFNYRLILRRKELGVLSPVRNGKRSAAFFDLDNTLIQGSSLFYLIRGMVTKGIVRRRSIARFGLAHMRYAKHGEENLQLMSQITSRALQFVAGKNQSALLNVCEEIVRDFLPKKAFPLMKHRIQEHQMLGHDTWLVTAAPSEIAEVVARELGMSGAIGTKIAVKHGHYLSELDNQPMHGLEKSHAVRNIAKSKGYNLQKSFAYSDSINDLPLLMTVGKPFTVNPNKELERIAKKNRWPVLVA